MRQVRVHRQREFLDLLEPGPVLTPATRQALIPMIAALLLETAMSEAKTTLVMYTERYDEQDRA